VKVPAPAPLMIFRRSEDAWRSCAASGPYWLDLYLLDLVECDLVAGAAVELGGARAFVRGHRLGVFERAAALEVGGNAGRAEVSSLPATRLWPRKQLIPNRADLQQWRLELGRSPPITRCS
jgi:hypothetical protein